MGHHVQASDSQASVSRFGPYQIEQRLAVGGSAEVFLAHREDAPDEKLVIKRLLPEVRERSNDDILRREAEYHQHVDHPNVVKVYHMGVVDEEPYLALEYVRGLDLYRLLQRSSSGKQAIPAELAVFIITRVAGALHAVHTANGHDGHPLNIVHGDVSPSNIYLSDQGEVKLGDFGIARVVSHTEVSVEAPRTAGHFGYLSPEQLTGEGHDLRSDVFALGVILGELLIGQRIFPGSGQLAIMLSIRDANILPLREAAPKLPAGLFEACQRALSRNPEDRYTTAQEFEAALAPFQTSPAQLAHSLASWVKWAMDHSRFVEDLAQRVKRSVGVLHAVHRSSSGVRALKDAPIPAGDTELSKIRRAGAKDVTEVSFPKLIEMVATGQLGLDDEVALWGAPFQPVGKIEELARHLLPSTTSVTSRLFTPGPPDFVADFADTPFLRVLGKLHNERATGSLFVCQSLNDKEHRKDIYVLEGRLFHVASNDPQELLGEYLIGKGVLSREQLDHALHHMTAHKGQLGEALIALNLVDAVEVFKALRNQGRDRVASLCAWNQGNGQLYRGETPEHVLFPLDLDLTICMMWGALQQRMRVPASAGKLTTGDNAPSPNTKASSVTVLTHVPALARKQVSIETARAELAATSKNVSRVAKLEAEAALVSAEALDWVRFR